MRLTQGLNNFNVYLGVNPDPLSGVKSVDLPEIAHKKVDLDMAGMGGAVSMPIPGQIDSMQLKLNASVQTIGMLRSAAPVSNEITVRAIFEQIDTGSGGRVTEARTYVCRGSCGTSGGGSLERGSENAASLEFELFYYKVMVAGSVVTEIDKFNNICIINGVDYAAEVRDAI
ncbi:MAG: phage major tail tube protein [Armatimonadota bacterium]|nr:phage major tail tube protein [bacterium]